MTGPTPAGPSAPPALPSLEAAAIARKRSVSIAGHQTSFSLEDPFWEALRAIAAARGQSVAALVRQIDGARGTSSLSGAIRVFILTALRPA